MGIVTAKAPGLIVPAFRYPTLTLPGQSVNRKAPSLLRQTCQVAGLYTYNAGQNMEILVANFPQPILQGNRIVICQGIFGAAQGNNNCMVGPTVIPVGPPLHPSGGGQDVGLAQSSPFAASNDILWLDVTATEAGSTTITFRTNVQSGVNYGACWAGEYSKIDTSDYGYFSGIDGSLGWTGTGTGIVLSRSAGQTCNVTPDLSVWCLCGGSGASVSGANYTQQGYVTDGANIFMAVQEGYFNTTGRFTANWNLSAAANYIGFNLTMKTLVFPS